MHVRLTCIKFGAKTSQSARCFAVMASDKELFSDSSASDIHLEEHPIIMRTSGSSDEEATCERSPVAIDMSELFRQKKGPCSKRRLPKESIQVNL